MSNVKNKPKIITSATCDADFYIKRSQNKTIPQKEQHFAVKKLFSELQTDYEKAKARNNLGMDALKEEIVRQAEEDIIERDVQIIWKTIEKN